jgi:CubicO group peptidase (beta-lactamase class C family)
MRRGAPWDRVYRRCVRAFAGPRLGPILLAAALAPAARGARADDPAPPDPRRDRIGAVALELLERHHVPGASVAVVDGGKIAWAKGYGVRDAKEKGDVDEHTLFQAASVTKAVTALAALRLVEAKAIGLDEDVGARLRSWRFPESEFVAEKKVTLRLLLAHGAGVNVHGFAGYKQDGPIPTLRQVLDGAPPATSPPIRVEGVPGAKYRYSGGGYLVLQQLLLDLQEPGKELEFPVLMRERVLVPLGLEDSTFELPLSSTRAARAASGHGGDGRVVPGRWRAYPESAAEGLWTTPTDLARVVLALFDALAGGAKAPLSKAMAAEMIEPQLLGSTMGLGLDVEGTDAGRRFGLDGGNAGYRCRFVAVPATGQAVVVMANGDRGDRVAAGVVAAVAREYAWPE